MRDQPPLVGITAAERPMTGLRGVYPAYAVNTFSVTGVTRAGGIPVLLPQVEPELAAVQLRPLTALVLSGGEDVDAGVYGREPDPRSIDTDAERDRWELALAAAARAAGIRILGICRGAQLLNVGRGGTLHGHLEWTGTHDLDIVNAAGRHLVEVGAGTRVASVLGEQPVAVASSHHQGIDALGAGLAVSARAPDGVIEAVESEDGRELGVQWHPEFQLDERAGQRVFDWLVDGDGGHRSPQR